MARQDGAAASLWPLFLVSAASVGYETALTRYFAVAKWSEYGYWVISIVMVGLALSGAVVALWRDALQRRADLLLSLLPVLLVATAALGFFGVTLVAFNPLQLQNPATAPRQLANIAAYYACLLPYFFCTGLFVSLSFVRNAGRLGRVYGYDLGGAGCGALLVLLLMLGLHPFLLVPALLLPLAFAGLRPPGFKRLVPAATLLCLAAGEAMLLLAPHAAYDEFKPIYAPLHVPDSRVLAQSVSPRGLYTLLDDFTERLDTDISNDAGMLGLPGPPRAYGLYRDGNRLAALPRPGPLDVRYAGATLAALPYLMHPGATVLMIGASGGFRPAEAKALGASRVVVVEPEPKLRAVLAHGLAGSPAFAAPGVTIAGGSPLAAAADGRFDIVDLSADFLDAAEGNAAAFTAEAVAAYLAALRPGGVVSLPVSIREFPSYALRLLATVRAGLILRHIPDPASHVVVYRSAWNVRILVSPAPWSPAAIAAVKRFCDDRSFDVSYYPGIDVTAARANIYNDLPAVSFSQGEVESGAGGHDAIADEALAVLRGEATPSQADFDLAPITFDRPFFYDVLRLDRLPVILRRIEALPQAEIGPLVNLAVLAQAAAVALLVLALPLLRPRTIGAGTARRVALRSVAYFPAIGLGFLFIEIALIDRATFYLADRASAFALVLTGMLVFSGLGALRSARLAAPRRAVALAVLVVVAWCAAVAVLAQPAMLASLDWPWALRAALVLAALAPVSLALGLPFPLGLAGAGDGMLPWAWALNGAFSVVATPLANLLALQAGYTWVLLSAAILYGIAATTFPGWRKSVSWQDISAT